MKKIRIWFITTCISFTLVILGQTVLGGIYLNDKYIIDIFKICVLINLFVNVTHYLDIKEWISDLISIIEIAGTIIIINYLYGFTVSIINSIIILIISTIIYFICSGIVYIKNSDDARKINEKIKRYRS